MPYTEEDFREFTKRTIPCDTEILGVRIPTIRKIAKSIPKEDFQEFLEAPTDSLEEVLARGFLIARLPYKEMIDYFDSQIQLVDNWAAVDTFCASLRKTLKNHEADFLEKKVETLLQSSKEYATRTGVVCLLDFYVREEYLQQVFRIHRKTRQPSGVLRQDGARVANCGVLHEVPERDFRVYGGRSNRQVDAQQKHLQDLRFLPGERRDEERG